MKDELILEFQEVLFAPYMCIIMCHLSVHVITFLSNNFG